MIPREVAARIRMEDLPSEDLKEIAFLCGVEVAIKLLNNFPGRNVYIPKNWSRHFIQKYVTQEYNGENAKELGKQLGVSFSTIYRALNEKAVHGAPMLPPRKRSEHQLDIFTEEKP
jgi:Mor family transcriptional regulator